MHAFLGCSFVTTRVGFVHQLLSDHNGLIDMGES